MTRRILLHVLFWLTYVSLDIYVAVVLMNYSYFDLDMGTRIMKALIPELLVLPPKLFMAYSIMYFILPKLNRSKWWRIILEVAIIFSVSLLMYHFILTGIIYPKIYKEQMPDSNLPQDVSRFMLRLLDMITVVGVACTFKLLRHQVKEAKMKQELIQEKLQSELNFLRAQTNPHFLFNTLNSIYALSRKQSSQTPEVVMQLSKLLRYMIHECREPFVSLDKEWKIIEDYVGLEKLRFGDRVNVKMMKLTSGNGEMIAPLLLLPLVENAFKHGAGNNRDHTEILIELRNDDDELHFIVENNFESIGESQEKSSGIGLQNVKRQLELLYPDHSMNIENRNGKFKVSISLKSMHNDLEVPHR